MRHLALTCAALTALCLPCLGQQPGSITTAHADPAFTPLLDPNGDGYITASGAAFTTDSTEAAEFEVPTDAISGWIEIFDVSEADSDITPACSNVDIAEDGNGGDIAFWTTTDPTPANPQSGDEHIVLRLRIADGYSGNFGYNFLVSTDGLYGAGVDPEAVAGNRGFEYEIQFSSGGNKKGVSGWDLDGLTTNGAVTCDKCVSIGDVQEATAAAAGTCTAGTPTFITFPLPLSYLGIGSDVSPEDLFIATATAASGNNTSVIAGGNVKDYGAFDDDQNAAACPGATNADLFDCLMDQAYTTQQDALPVTLVSFSAHRSGGVDHLTWAAVDEVGFDRYDVERSLDARTWATVGRVGGSGADDGEGVAAYRFAYGAHDAVCYYRLRARDLDGGSELSRVVAVAGAVVGEGAFTIAPNPAHRYLHVRTEADGGSATAYDLLGSDGRVALRGTLDGSEGVLEVGGLPRGLYVLTVRGDGRTEARRVLLR